MGLRIQYKELKAEIRDVVVEIPRHRVEWLGGLYFVKYVGEDHGGGLLEGVQWNI